MKPSKWNGKSLISTKRVVIRITFMDLIGRLGDLAKDDAALITSVRRILEACNVRMLDSMAPIRLASGRSKPATRRRARGIKTPPAWM
jgi:hypothetical protein